MSSLSRRLAHHRAQCKEFGIGRYLRFRWRLLRRRLSTGVAGRILPHRVHCPCCDWTGHRFADYIEVGYTVPRMECPRCHSHARHRALYLWLKNDFKVQEKSGDALIFAPEPGLSQVWDSAPQLRIHGIDIEAAPGVDMLADIVKLPIQSECAGFIWCHHVLEHIEDDRAAIAELHRVLRPQSGCLIVSVPMGAGASTREYGFSNPLETGHWRCYGDDFIDRLKAAGFCARAVHYASGLSPQECRRYGISATHFYVCHKPGTAPQA